MPVNLEIKGLLAKLLATEDIIVEHKKVETACFNVQTRVLTLPMWERASNNVYTMLVLHEISHSLFTPNEDWSQNTKVPPQFVNLVEDVRVEKLCKRKYPGSPKSFFNGYKELHDEDFFCVKDENVNKMNLADKANLYFKVGNFLRIDFTAEEKSIIDLIASAETFPEALNAAEVLYRFCKQKQQEETKINLDSHPSQTSGSGQNPGSNPLDDEVEGEGEEQNGSPKDDQEEQSGEVDKENDNKASNQGGTTAEPEVKTMESFDEALKNLLSMSESENAYIEIPKLDLKHVIIDNAEIHDRCRTEWEVQALRHNQNFNPDHRFDIFSTVDNDYIQFKRSAQKEVNYLVKEFECRKAADSYARATTARTGILDCTKLHTYKYNEDLFKKVTTLSNGKNHGLVFILDWSGSMSDVIIDTVKQLFNLIWFCKKVSIPFEVYAFTNDYPRKGDPENGGHPMPPYTKKHGIFCVENWFSLLHLLTHKVSNKVLEEQMKNIYRLAKCFGRHNYYASYSAPSGLGLSGTPLNESLIALYQILPQFKRENNLQKIQCVILTDGEGSPLRYHKEFNRKWETEPYLGINNVDHNSFLRDRKTGNTYSFNCGWTGFTDVLLRNLRDNFTDVNFIGIRVLEGRDCGHFIRRYCGHYGTEYDKVMGSWKKEKSFAIKSSGYHSYFGLSSSILDSDTEFSVAEDASKSQIKNAFAKSLKGKKLNKKVLGEFIELVA